MSYQVIARKWRPQSFDQLIGQSHVSMTLKNALKRGRVPHALLFTGPRGTGKTSTARLIAKSLKCEDPKEFEACGQCASCLEFQEGRSIDVIEIDAASNNGVDSVRELRDAVGYMPSKGKYKIYIIDEVHMLSTAAFNALLKTLEEPPAHVVFVLATTEVQKIPATILSRCQRFDFRRISARQVMEHLKFICEQEGIKVETDALWVIARQGDGSMRDSQTLLDQVITFSDGDLSSEKVVEILGLTDRSLILACLGALARRDSEAMLKCLSDVQSSGVDPSLFLGDVLESLRHWLLVKKGQEQGSRLLEISDSELVFMQDISLQTTEEDIHALFDMCLKGANDIQRSSDPLSVLEMVLLRMTLTPKMESIAELIARAMGGSEPARKNSSQVKSAPALRSTDGTASEAASVSNVKRSALSRPPLEKWIETVAEIKAEDSLLSAKVEQLSFVGSTESDVLLSVPPNLSFLQDLFKDPQALKVIKAAIHKVWGVKFNIRLRPFTEQSGSSVVAVSEAKKKEAEQSMMDQITQHPKIKGAMTSFNASIKSVRDLKKE